MSNEQKKKRIRSEPEGEQDQRKEEDEIRQLRAEIAAAKLEAEEHRKKKEEHRKKREAAEAEMEEHRKKREAAEAETAEHRKKREAAEAETEEHRKKKEEHRKKREAAEAETEEHRKKRETADARAETAEEEKHALSVEFYFDKRNQDMMKAVDNVTGSSAHTATKYLPATKSLMDFPDPRPFPETWGKSLRSYSSVVSSIHSEDGVISLVEGLLNDVIQALGLEKQAHYLEKVSHP